MTVDLLERRPGPIPHSRWRIPLLGDLVGAKFRTPIQDAMQRGRDLGPVYERKIFGKRATVVFDVDMVAELSDERRFGKYNSSGINAMRKLGGDGLFTAYTEEPNWGKAHNLLRPAFTQSAMRSYHSIMADVADELVRYWGSSTGPVDVPSDMTKVTFETIGRTACSFSFDSFQRERPHPLAAAMIGTMRHALVRSSFTPPVVGELMWRRADLRDDARVDYIHRTVDEVIAARIENGHSDSDDLLASMLRAADENDPNALDRLSIRLQIITFLVAGHETSAGALSFALYYLATNPHVLQAARSEVDEVWGRTDRPEFEQVAKLRYLRRVLDETLRLWPTAPVYGRRARFDTELGGGRLALKKDAGVLILLPMLHRLPDVWGSDSESFDPDRFLPARVKSRPAHAYKPFGTGERACIGRQFALHEAVLVLGTILQRYDLTADLEYRLDVGERLSVVPKGFRMTVTPRT